ncbi:MAG: hypothetical protein K9K38_04945 [Rhodoferax sp.]|nr:hypothetical protein [Rhodoferax sp.]
MKTLFIFANVVAAILALLAAFNMLVTTSLSVDHLLRGGIALVIGMTCIWIARQSAAPSGPALH